MCAMQEEADPLQRRLDDRAADEHDVVVGVCGFGKVNAAVATAALVGTAEPELVLGRRRLRRLVPGDGQTFWLSHAVQHDYGGVPWRRIRALHRWRPAPRPGLGGALRRDHRPRARVAARHDRER